MPGWPVYSWKVKVLLELSSLVLFYLLRLALKVTFGWQFLLLSATLNDVAWWTPFMKLRGMVRVARRRLS